MRSKVTYQGQGSSEVRLGWKMLFFVIWVSLEKLKFIWNQTWVKDAVGFFCMLMRSIVKYQGQVSSEVKLGRKCQIGIIFLKSWKSNYNHTWFVDATCEPLTQWVALVLVKLSFLSYFFFFAIASYYDIGVPCKLLPPCRGDRASLLAVFCLNAISYIIPHCRFGVE